MSTTAYTSIPDTSDTDYWQLKSISTKDRSRIFIPKDAELHRSLLIKLQQASSKRIQRERQLTISRRQSVTRARSITK